MRKYIILLIIAIIFSNCDIKPRTAKANEGNLLCDVSPACVTYRYINIGGMKYLITGIYYGGSTVTNITKDSLECEYYRKQLSKQ
jgi:hypothetical protein